MPIHSTITMSHVEGVSDSSRARELYKYYQPTGVQNVDACIQEPSALQHPNYPDPFHNEEPKIESNVSSSKISSPDTALTAFAQLTSWRIGSQRAMISVIDGATQYFIAESTKTVDLVDSTKHAPGDDLWMGCDSVSKAGRLCERTIGLPPAPPGQYPAFIVNDLSKDERFNQLPFVSGAPFLKFYAGTPLITKRGIPIGSLFVVDNRVRNGLSQDEIHFMGTMASTIMRHMEITREVEEHRRGMKMSRGLASFVEGRSELQEDELDNDDEGATIAGQFEEERPFGRTRPGSVRLSVAESVAGSVSSIERREKEYSNAMIETEQAIMSSNLQAANNSVSGARPSQNFVSLGSGALSLSDDASQAGTESVAHVERTTGQEENTVSGLSLSVSSPKADSPGGPKLSRTSSNDDEESLTTRSIFSRASNLIREAFEVDGGAVFYDAQKTFGSEYSPNNAPSKNANSPLQDDVTNNELDPIDEALSPGSRKTETPKVPKSNINSRTTIHPDKIVELLGFSTPLAASVHEDPVPGPTVFAPFDEKSLHTLLKRYPKGKLWTFDEDGSISSSEDDKKLEALKVAYGQADSPRHAVRSQRKRTRTVAEARFLLRHFPGVRQLLFVPLWDAGRSRWLSGCFTWSNQPTRVLSKQSELAFLSAFCNSVMAECSRLDTEVADQKKSDFIGSISHELRSPLHGILASAEFLGEEITEGFSRGLVETIDSCGRTLLDTINHILDFSKINNFEKNWRRSRRAGSSRLPGHQSLKVPGSASIGTSQHSDLPMINLFAEVDISTITEEVVEGVFAGHVFQNSTASSFDMVPSAREKMLDPRHTSNMLGENFNSQSKDVAVILDIGLDNYSFTTQPGAFRRVIMNLLGNALKYTSRGYVHVKLETTAMDDWQQAGHVETVPRSLVTLTVTDTGKGISNEFLRSKLFTPFAQENSLSSGTGLGLSIVRSIVALLEGDIQFKSELGKGTEVKITLPLLRSIPRTTDSNGSGSTPKSTHSVVREPDESISNVRAQIVGLKVAFTGFDIGNPDTMVAETAKYLKSSTEKFLTEWYGLEVVSDSKTADIVIIDEDVPGNASQIAGFHPIGRQRPIVLVLCSHSSHYSRSMAAPGLNENIGYVAKPIGPLKLARALLTCLNNRSITPGVTPGEAPTARQQHTPDLSTTFEELHMSSRGGEILDNSRMAADSNNARKAIESPTPTANIERYEAFPFPADRPTIPKNKSMPTDQHEIGELGKDAEKKRASSVLSKMETTATAAQIPKPLTTIKPAPRLLLVDDNKINLRLLRTYMLKRRYTLVDEAENGLEAVHAVQEQSEGYDIIFMDVSMPVLDGFGATRQIRQFERQRRDRAAGNDKAAGKAALIIALTGLASSRDQQEAFSSGLDLFLTKPVSFKEVGKLLDNWEANRGREVERNGN